MGRKRSGATSLATLDPMRRIMPGKTLGVWSIVLRFRQLKLGAQQIRQLVVKDDTHANPGRLGKEIPDLRPPDHAALEFEVDHSWFAHPTSNGRA
jgi:hypothetical protein